jgi:hypothetical protein
MSDIYLQITETPTVVTLSAPVVSGALASTVTVANTVTVALDSNSLSALENVTVTVGAAITGTVTVGNSVTISSLPAISGTVTANVFGKNFDGSVQLFTNNNGGARTYDGGGAVAVGFNDNINENFAHVSTDRPFPIQGTVTIGNSVTISSLPAISGTVTVGSALPAGTNRIGVVTIGGGTVTIGAGTAQIGSVTASISNFPATQAVSLTTLPALVAGTAQIGSVTASISGTVPVSGTFFQATQPASLASLPALAAGTNQIGSVTASISGTVPISISSVTVGNSITIGSLPALVAGTAQIGSVTASISGTVPISISSVTVGNSVTIGSLPALAAGTAQIGSVTASISANPSGALTTRFGSVTTANTAQITTAVTNTSRKYLFAQNISIGSVTMGIGFSPTTTQGIQLSAGSGIVFDSFCPTGAVYWLGATTGAAWSILEG